MAEVPTETPSADTLAEMATLTKLLRTLLQSAERLRRMLDVCYASSDLNGPRVDVMELIEASHPDGCSQTSLSGQLGAAESSVSMLIERMRRDGLLLRMRSRLDRRCCVLLLTELGQQKLEQVQTIRDGAIHSIRSRFSPEALQQMTGLLHQLLQALEAITSAQTFPTNAEPQSEWGQAA